MESNLLVSHLHYHFDSMPEGRSLRFPAGASASSTALVLQAELRQVSKVVPRTSHITAEAPRILPEEPAEISTDIAPHLTPPPPQTGPETLASRNVEETEQRFIDAKDLPDLVTHGSLEEAEAIEEDIASPCSSEEGEATREDVVSPGSLGEEEVPKEELTSHDSVEGPTAAQEGLVSDMSRPAEKEELYVSHVSHSERAASVVSTSTQTRAKKPAKEQTGQTEVTIPIDRRPPFVSGPFKEKVKVPNVKLVPVADSKGKLISLLPSLQNMLPGFPS